MGDQQPLWLAIQLPHLALDLQTRGNELQRDLPLAISRSDGQRELIDDCNPAAERLGIRRGLPANAARGLAEGLVIVPHDPAATQLALERIASWCYQYSSAVCPQAESDSLLLEVAGSERLFGDSRALAQRISDELMLLGYHVRTGIAPYPEAAQFAAVRGLTLTTPDALRQALREAPLDALLLQAPQQTALEKMGFRSCSEVLRLPRKDLARRLGTDFLDYLDRLTGARPDPQRRWHSPERFVSRLDLPAEVSNSKRLLFPLRRQLSELCGVLRAADRGIQCLHIELQLRQGTQDLTLQLQQPSRDEAHLMLLLAERIDRLRLTSPALQVCLSAGDFLPFDAAPSGLFLDPDDPASNPVEPLLERLRARLGDNAVAGLRGVEDHRPEHSWSFRAPQEPAQCQAMAHRPVWLFEQPQRCHIDEYRVLAGPERIESGWWDGRDCRRDYFVVRDQGGSTLWAYREYKPSPGWYLQGLFA